MCAETMPTRYFEPMERSTAAERGLAAAINVASELPDAEYCQRE